MRYLRQDNKLDKNRIKQHTATIRDYLKSQENIDYKRPAKRTDDDLLSQSMSLTESSGDGKVDDLLKSDSSNSISDSGLGDKSEEETQRGFSEVGKQLLRGLHHLGSLIDEWQLKDIPDSIFYERAKRKIKFVLHRSEYYAQRDSEYRQKHAETVRDMHQAFTDAEYSN